MTTTSEKKTRGRVSRYTSEHRAWMRAMEEAGYSHFEIARRFRLKYDLPLSMNTVHKLLYVPGVSKREKLPPRTWVRLSPDDQERVRVVAANLGYIDGTGPRMGEGSLSELLGAIGRGDVLVFVPDEFDDVVDVRIPDL